MTYKRKQLPKYCLHKGSGQAYVRIAGDMHYLGKHGSDASRREYDRIMGEFIANGRQAFRHPDEITVAGLIVRYRDAVHFAFDMTRQFIAVTIGGMGSPPSEQDRGTMETQHQVTLSHGFWLLETPVTQGMWEKVMGNNPSNFKGTKLPVESVSWNDCQEYIQKLNDMQVAPEGYRFSLPT